MDGLTKRPVDSYLAISTSLIEGEKNRTIAATKMNETSSRAHTIVTLNFHQIKPDNITLISKINLVDLAGRQVYNLVIRHKMYFNILPNYATRQLMCRI